MSQVADVINALLSKLADKDVKLAAQSADLTAANAERLDDADKQALAAAQTAISSN